MERYSVRGCRVMGCRDSVSGVEGHSVGDVVLWAAMRKGSMGMI